MEETNELLDSQNEENSEETTVENTVETTEESVTDTETVDVEALKKANRELFVRAKKAEGFVFKDGKWVKAQKPAQKQEIETPKNEVTLSPKDYLSLTENKISSDDFDEVVKISKVLGKSIADTLKDKTTKVILSQRAEERASAEATATSSQRQRVKTASDEDIVNNATSGKIPDNPEDLVKAEIALKKKRAGIKD